MLAKEKRLQGWGLSLLIHAILAGTVYWFWQRTLQQSEQSEPIRWEVSMFSAASPPPPAMVEESPPDTLAEPTMADLPPPSTSNPGKMPDFAPAAFVMPALSAPIPGMIGNIALPAGALSGVVGVGAEGGEGSLAGSGLGGGAANPSPIVRVPPAYPLEARRKKIEGWVKVEFTVLENGSVTATKVRAAEPSGIFEQAAMAAIEQWKFNPATENGKAIQRRVAQTLRFDLNS